MTNLERKARLDEAKRALRLENFWRVSPATRSVIENMLELITARKSVEYARN